MYITWTGPDYSEEVAYTLYRATSSDVSDLAEVSGVLAVQGGGVLDAHPLPGHVWYAVTAADTSGNESAYSTPVDINPGLLPVSQIAVVVDGDNPPQVSWTHPAAASIAGYNLYVNDAATPFNAGLLTDTSFTDYGYAGDTRRYTLEADDGSDRSQQRSITPAGPALCA